MKIEKVNEHQIRCTLTQEDLASRKLKLSELAYGSEKAKELFRDMMEKANDEYGFEADNIPLMIEAIPVSSECIVLIITKVDDPEELDTRFSKFAPGITEKDEDGDSSDSDSDDPTDAVNISDLFKKFKNAASAVNDKASDVKPTAFDGMAFSFNSISDLAAICKTASNYFHGTSSLYLNPENGKYLLTVSRDKSDVTDYVQTCNLFSEYGAPLRHKTLSESYLKEHFELICNKNAIETLIDLA